MRTAEAPQIVVQRSYIDGEWVELDKTGNMLCDPNTGEARQTKLTTSPTDVERALEAAHRFDCDGLADSIPLATRIEVMERFALALEHRQDEIAIQDSINTGVPLSTTRLVASSLGGRVRSVIAEAVALGEAVELSTGDTPVRLLRRPLGPAVIIAPWNVPSFTASGKVAAALLAGCPVLLKPSENSPSGIQLIAEALVDVLNERGLPGSYFQLLQGGSGIGRLLTGDPRIATLVFTGGVETGRSVAQSAASVLAITQLELGSNNPVIVRRDADVARTAASLVQGTTRVNGQWCEAPGKILVHSSIHDELAEAIRDEFASLQIGHSLEAGTQLGPLAFERHRDDLVGEVHRLEGLGGKLLGTQQLPDLGGWFIEPGVIVGADADDAHTELFGPLLTMHQYEDESVALHQANHPSGGLDAFVFSSDIEAAMALAGRMRAGEIRINGTFMTDLANGSQQSFWGTSGVGGHGPEHGVRFFTGDRVIGVDSGDFAL